uniref:CCDC66 domain-containing protein n=1 Tax=Heterorhabditis bacteriophora TaxID=37862 RepID=A0A1I7XNH0_HETBA
MVRTYAYNPSTQNSEFGNHKLYAPPPDPIPTAIPFSHEQTRVVSMQPQPSLDMVAQSYPSVFGEGYTPFHSPYVDPVGSIVGLRILYIEGKLCYVPVEPQVNYMINQQFGVRTIIISYGLSHNINNKNNNYLPPPNSNSPPSIPPINQQHSQISDQRNQNQYIGVMPNQVEVQVEEPAWISPHPQPKSGVRRSKQWRTDVDQPFNNNSSSSFFLASSGRSPSVIPVNNMSSSMPNLNGRGLSDAEQHKLDLQKQIEDNRRRREMEKQKERLEEEREIRKQEAYNTRIQMEEQEEKRRTKERAFAAERLQQQIHEERLVMTKQVVRKRSPSSKMRGAEPDQRSTTPSEAPREEWWEKKPSWQQRKIEEDRRSAVIPTMRNKPPRPRTPSAGSRTYSRQSRTGYNPSASVEEHQNAEEDRRDSNIRGSSSRSISNSSTRSGRYYNVVREDNQEIQQNINRTMETGATLLNEQNEVPSGFQTQRFARTTNCIRYKFLMFINK